MAEPKNIAFYQGSEEWSALYVDGKLAHVGDHYWVQEQLLYELGVEVISSDDFLRGGDDRESVAQNLTELEAYSASREEHEAQAELLEAESLEAEARSLEARAKELREAASRI